MNSSGPCTVAPRVDASFKRTVRLLLNQDFQRVFGAGRSIAGKTMVIWSAPGEAASFRMGVVASKRTFRRAVDRNRAKRRLRETFRLERWRLCGTGDLVIVARRRILDTEAMEVRAEFLKLMRALGVNVTDGGNDGDGQ